MIIVCDVANLKSTRPQLAPIEQSPALSLAFKPEPLLTLSFISSPTPFRPSKTAGVAKATRRPTHLDIADALPVPHDASDDVYTSISSGDASPAGAVHELVREHDGDEIDRRDGLGG